jgi:hypothetical protein
MTTKEIHESLDAMLSNTKTKNFLNHLVRAYFPITNVDKVWDKPKGPFKCVLTKETLFSLQDILEGIKTEEFKNDFISNIKNVFTENFDTSHPLVKLIGDRKMGVTGTDTTTYMSYTAMQEFYNWVLTKSLKGDKHINWLLSSVRRSTIIDMAQNIDDADVQSRIKKSKKQETSASSFTLGELDAFKKLKEKFND